MSTELAYKEHAGPSNIMTPEFSDLMNSESSDLPVRNPESSGLRNPEPSDLRNPESSDVMNKDSADIINPESFKELHKIAAIDPKILQKISSFDPKILQRAPSIYSIRNNKSLQLQHCSFDGKMETISETGEISGDAESLSSYTIMIKNDPLSESIDINSTVSTSEEIANIGGCIECVKAIPVYSADELEVGDHIVFAGAVYDHHGIIVEKISDETFKVVEATNTFFGAVAGIIFGGKAKICSSEKKFNFKIQNIRVVEYRKRLYSKIDVAKRAIEHAEGTNKTKNGEFKYDLFDNNCEHFATSCVTGMKFSIQVTKFRLTAKLFLSSGFIGISDEQKRNDKEFENNIICKECHCMNKNILGVKLIQIRQETDVEKGDIIRYTYYNLWHEAVVLDITSKKQKYITCSIAHYAFCGISHHRTIKEESLDIHFNGKCNKLEYKHPEFNVYDPEMVIQRAQKRIGEKQFVFFSNDSSHFARWCKLKLRK